MKDYVMPGGASGHSANSAEPAPDAPLLEADALPSNHFASGKSA